MSTPFPCPNSSCGYMFDPAQLPAAAMVTCPYCATRFPWKNGRILTLPTQPAPAPVAPAATDYSFEEPAATSDETEPSRYAGSRSNRLVNPSQKPPSGVGRTLVLVTVFALVLAGLLFSLVGMKRGGSFVGKPGQSLNPLGTQTLEPINCSYDMPKGWVDDSTLRGADKLQAAVLRRGTEPVWLALQGKDFDDREPRASELADMLIPRLKRTFESMEFENRQGVEGTFGGLKGKEYSFKGTMEEMTVSGRAWTASYKGIGYLFVVWADDATPHLNAKLIADLKGRFKLLKNRETWKSKVTNEATFTPEMEDYRLVDREGIWLSRIKSQIRDASKIREVLESASEADPAAGIALVGRHPRSTRDRPLSAMAMVVSIPKGDGTPLETAKAWLEAKLVKEAEESMSGKPILEAAAVSPSGDESKAETPIPVEKLQMRIEGGGADKIFYAISAIDLGEKDGKAMVAATIVEATWKNAQFMESYMVNIAASLSKK